MKLFGGKFKIKASIRFRSFPWEKEDGQMGLIDQVKVLLRIRKPATQLIQEVSKVKSGWKTSEFWMTVVIQVIAVVGALNGVVDPKVAGTIVAVLNAVYAVLRTLAKTPESAPVETKA